MTTPRTTLRTAPRAATARERARAELTREIKEEARRQLAAAGGGGLSLRAVARELGMVSSALYRYYPSRDDLLTALIIDAYNALGDVAEQAVAGAGPARERWVAACRAIRDWARSNPHEYALIYGSPVPGYRAPEATIGPASRVPLALVGVVRGAMSAGELTVPGEALPVEPARSPGRRPRCPRRSRGRAPRGTAWKRRAAGTARPRCRRTCCCAPSSPGLSCSG